ncbi:MAG: hypothetical protein QG670_1898 [Thermoproteota archaeon]|nr:hypothetical protein [Thermoproteota archaeon]
MGLIKTGIAGLDEFLGGGLLPRVYVLLGSPGSENDLFARQVAYNRTTLGGISYFLCSKTPESIRDDMLCYKLDVASKEENGVWRFIKLDKEKNLTDIFSRETKQQRSIVLDSLSDILLTTPDMEKIRELLNLLSSRSREKNELYLLLLTEGMHDQKVEVSIEHFADGVIRFTTIWSGENSIRTLNFKKLNGATVPSRSLVYSIGSRGFIIETTTRIT